MVRRIENGVLEDARSVGVGQEDRKFSNSMRLSRAHRRQILSSDRKNIGSRIRLPLFIFASQNRRSLNFRLPIFASPLRYALVTALPGPRKLVPLVPGCRLKPLPLVKEPRFRRVNLNPKKFLLRVVGQTYFGISQPPQHLGARPIHFFTAAFWMHHVKADARGRSHWALFPFIGVTFSFAGLNKYPNPDVTRARESV